MRALKIFIGFGLSLVFLYLTLFIPHIGAFLSGESGLGKALFGNMRFSLHELGQVFAQTRVKPIVLAAIVFAATLLLRAWRWRLMLAPLVSMSFLHVFAAMTIGYMANNVLPLRMGEVYRAQVVYQLSGLSRSAAFGCVVLERVVDLLFMIPYLGLTFLLIPLGPEITRAAYVTAGVAFAVTAFFVWLVFDRVRALKWAEAVLKILPTRLRVSMIHLIDRFTSGLSVLGRTDLFLRFATSSILLWAMYALMVYLVLDSVGFMDSGLIRIEQNPVGAVLAVLILTTIGLVIPSAPGAVGTYHGATVLGLGLLFNVPADRAVGFAILLHALNYIPLTGLGLLFFWRYGFSFRESANLATTAESAATQ